MSDHQTTKPAKINRMDPAWAQFAAAALRAEMSRTSGLYDGNPNKCIRIGWCASQADAMIRERDRRDREDRE